MKLSARNILRGTIIEVIKGQTTAHVRLDIKGPVVTASITNEAVDDLGLKKVMAATAVIKASADASRSPTARSSSRPHASTTPSCAARPSSICRGHASKPSSFRDGPQGRTRNP